MIAVTVMTTLCSGAVAFYVRFLVAMMGEYKKTGICYLARLRSETDPLPISETREVDISISRAA